MKKTILSACALAASAGLASADVYADSTGEVFDAGFTHLDISSVTLSNDADWLYITAQMQGDLDATTWGKYAIGIDTGKFVGSNSNGWGRNIDWGRNITHWSATWTDDGGSGAGGELYTWDGGAWVLDGATYQPAPTIIQGDASLHFVGIQKWQISLAELGVSVGDTIEFDVITTAGGGTDPGVDHLSRADQSTPFWDTQSVAGDFLSYTIVPAPGSVALLGLGGLVAARRRR
ncbi:MAG: PEP-CTERM sorting domain-containing protein [Phycisphaerales bacterium JB040]